MEVYGLEEKKAIERIDYIQDFIIENGQYNADVNDMEYFSKVLNLIKKQSKEIEELKIQNNKLAQCHFKYEEMTGVDLLLPDKLEYTSNDKIKAKMKEKEWALENYDCTEADYKQSQAIGAWSVLQSLLEKE